MNNNNVIAVVTPVYNGEHTIQHSINSLLAQTATNWISVIVNDGSTDKTAEVLDQYRDDERFHIIHLEKNLGRPIARRTALEHVQKIGATYLCMLDADDLYYPDKLKWQFNYMQSNQEVTLMSCSIGYIDAATNLLGVLETVNTEKVLRFDRYDNYLPVPHASSIIRVSEIGDITYDPKLSLGQDQDFMIRLLLNKTYAYVPTIGYLYNRADSFSFKKYRKSLVLSLYIKEKLNLPKAYLLKCKIRNYLKITIVGFLSLIGRENLFLSKIGREPSKEELNNHSSALSR